MTQNCTQKMDTGLQVQLSKASSILIKGTKFPVAIPHNNPSSQDETKTQGSLIKIKIIMMIIIILHLIRSLYFKSSAYTTWPCRA